MSLPGDRIHEIIVDRARRLVDVRLFRIPSPEDSGWIGEEVRETVRGFGPLIGTHVTLYDCTALAVVPPATIEAVRHTFANPSVTPLRARRIAVAVANTLVRLQTQRIAEVVPEMRIFERRDDALAWLFER